jgi:class 3 adenylate cyclase
METIDASVLIFDIRNFTDNLKYYEERKDDSFLLFVQEICSCGHNIYRQLSPCNNLYFNTTGDGFLLVFGENNHFITCYLFGIIFNIIATRKFTSYNKIADKKLSYGIGIETGKVKKIIISDTPDYLFTYIGNVINIASRIETETKNHARTNMIIGNQINQLLVKELYNVDYSSLMEEVKTQNNEERIPILINEMNIINHGLLLSYMFEHNLKGVDEPIPLFRLSPSLLKQDEKNVNNIIERLAKIINRKDNITHIMEEADG